MLPKYAILFWFFTTIGLRWGKHGCGSGVFRCWSYSNGYNEGGNLFTGCRIDCL